MSDAGRLMDGIYRTQRHVYDATRKYYLLGRDDLIADLDPLSGASILEIGCGTGRNLVKIASTYPDTACYGIDVSSAMLETARKAVAKAGLGARITLAEADATAFDPQALFGVAAFDRVVISYALSMIPPWQAVLRQAATMIAPGGSMRIVDFGDQAGLPVAFKRGLEAWLARFHVAPRVTLPDAIAEVAQDLRLRGTTRPLYRGYAVAARLDAKRR